jgi:hypothetical protein
LGKGYGFQSGFPPFSFTETLRGCVSFKKLKSQGNNKEKNSEDFCLDFVQELAFWTSAA